MRIGITAYNMTGSELIELAELAEEFGFGSLWLGEHILWPMHYAAPHPTEAQQGQPELARPIIDPNTRLVDPLVSLAAVAAATSTIEVGTAIYLLALRPPLVTARAAATVQEIAAGRFFLGVGTGWLKEEFQALGVPFEERVSRFDEAVELLGKAWSGGEFQHAGKWYPTSGPVQLTSEPCRVPIVFGGNTERAFQRAALAADGWFASGTPTLEEFVRMRDRIEALRAHHGRTGGFRFWVRVNTWDPDEIEKYRAEGVDEVLIWARSPYVATPRNEVWTGQTTDERRQRLAEVAAALGV